MEHAIVPLLRQPPRGPFKEVWALFMDFSPSTPFLPAALLAMVWATAPVVMIVSIICFFPPLFELAMLVSFRWLRLFQVIDAHFRFRAAEIIKRCDKWAMDDIESPSGDPSRRYNKPVPGRASGPQKSLRALAEEIKGLLRQKYNGA